jgi:hypothetical protein
LLLVVLLAVMALQVVAVAVEPVVFGAEPHQFHQLQHTQLRLAQAAL